MEKAKKVAEILNMNGINSEAKMLNKDGYDQPAVVVLDGTNLCPAFYTNKFGDMPEDDVAHTIAEMIVCMEKPDVDESDLEDFEKMKEHLRVGFLPYRATKNPEWLCRDFLDLTAYIYLDFGNGTAKVTDKMINLWNTDIKNVLTTATGNTKKIAYRTSMADKLSKMTGTEIEDDGQLKICSVDGDRFGAVTLMFTGLFEDISNEWEYDDLYILPSSVHEVLVARASISDLNDLKDMVKEVNDTELEDKDLLSYSVYKYSFIENKISIA